MIAGRIAVVIPVGRDHALLCEALESILSQKAAEAHLIVITVYDLACWNTREVAEGYRTAYPDKIRVLITGTGPNDARNAAANYLLKATSDIEAVVFLNPEDKIEEGGLDLLKKSARLR